MAYTRCHFKNGTGSVDQIKPRVIAWSVTMNKLTITHGFEIPAVNGVVILYATKAIKSDIIM